MNQGIWLNTDMHPTPGAIALPTAWLNVMGQVCSSGVKPCNKPSTNATMSIVVMVNPFGHLSLMDSAVVGFVLAVTGFVLGL